MASLALVFSSCQQGDRRCCAAVPRCTAGGTAAPVPETALRKLAAAMRSLDAPSYQFPWRGLEADLARQPNKELLLVGYGSLLSRESAAETIAGAERQEFTPVIAAGAQRVFNYRIPPSVLEEMGGHSSPRESAALNVVVTGRSDDIINGRLIAVAIKDLPALRIREHGYHLRPVVCIPWGKDNAKPFTAYVLAAEEPIVNGQKVIDRPLLPNPPYVRICYQGAKSVSPQFADCFSTPAI